MTNTNTNTNQIEANENLEYQEVATDGQYSIGYLADGTAVQTDMHGDYSKAKAGSTFRADYADFELIDNRWQEVVE